MLKLRHLLLGAGAILTIDQLVKLTQLQKGYSVSIKNFALERGEKISILITFNAVVTNSSDVDVEVTGISGGIAWGGQTFVRYTSAKSVFVKAGSSAVIPVKALLPVTASTLTSFINLASSKNPYITVTYNVRVSPKVFRLIPVPVTIDYKERYNAAGYISTLKNVWENLKSYAKSYSQ